MLLLFFIGVEMFSQNKTIIWWNCFDDPKHGVLFTFPIKHIPFGEDEKDSRSDYYTLSRGTTHQHTPKRSTNILRLSIHTQTCIHCIKGTVNKKKRNKIFLLKIFNCFSNEILSAANPRKSSITSLHCTTLTQIPLIT